jgi:acyl carrier protein
VKDVLPDHMIPSEFLIVDALPMTPNGKVDREALSRIRGLPAAFGHNFVSPRNSVEEKLHDIWSEVLQSKQIGIHDSFFELGGHSLTATQVLSRIRAHFGMEIAVREFFAQPTIAGLGEHIRQNTKKEIQTISPAPRDRDLPLSFGQQRLWFLYEFEGEGSHYNLMRAYRISGPFNIPVLEQALTEIVRRHESLRTTFPSEDGIPKQSIAPPTPVKIKQFDLSHLEPEQRAAQSQQFLQEETRRPFVLEQGPILRPSLIKLEKEDHIFLITIHHIATDFWSNWVINKELMVLYDAFLKDQPSPLPELPIQYADFALWQRQWMNGEIMEKLLSYWKRKLNETSELELPTDRPRPRVQNFAGKTQTETIDMSLRNKLQSLSENQGVTLFMTLFAAYQTLLHLLSGQCDITVGVPIANRNQLEIENLIGFFVNTLILRCDLSGDPSFRKLLSRVRETSLEAYAHQDLPFEKLVEKLKPKRTTNRTPFFQTMFVFQNSPVHPLELNGLVIKPIQLESGTGIFDLSLSIFVERECLQTSWNYRTDLFSDSTVIGWMNKFRSILERIVVDPDRSLSSFS